MNNKSQLGETITWMVAFVIIFFIVILFVIFSLVLSGEKIVFYGKDKIILNKNSVNLDSQNFLFDFLDDEMNGESVKEFIINKNNDLDILEDKLKKKVEDKLKKLGECNYLFSIEYDPENLKEYKEGKADLLYRKIDFGNAFLIDKGSNELFAEGSIISLFSNEENFEKTIKSKFSNENFAEISSGNRNYAKFSEKRILIKFYLGECAI